jgi:hypothetical protein
MMSAATAELASARGTIAPKGPATAY